MFAQKTLKVKNWSMWMLGVVGVAVLALGLTVLPLLANGLSIVAPFDPLAGELPEALAVDDDGDIFVGMAPTGEVKKVTPDGDQDFFAQLPSPAGGFMTGMKLGEDDMLYVGLASFNVDTGIYRVGPEGGAAELFASLPEMSVPNGLEFDEGGNLYVSNTNFGRIWKIGPDGNVTTWSDDALLMGMVLPGPLPFPLAPVPRRAWRPHFPGARRREVPETREDLAGPTPASR